MAPAASKSKAYSNPVATQADDPKYRGKYKELKVKVQEIEEDNEKLSVRILKSKKAIQRLRIERAILYDRLQSTAAPTNPYALSSAMHLSALASSSSSDPSTSNPNAPPSILSAPSYPLADPAAPDLFLKQLDAQKLAAIQRGNGSTTTTEYSEQPVQGVAGEGRAAKEQEALMAAGGPVNGAVGASETNGHSAPALAEAEFLPAPTRSSDAIGTDISQSYVSESIRVRPWLEYV
ncbi:hypothetical protein JCM11251_004565 [Rhodosporidiobolus azoricus]